MLGKILDGRYQIFELLGAGGYGQTYIAHDTRRPGHPVCVVKQLKPNNNSASSLKTARRLFLSEAETLEKLGKHEQIPQLLAYFEEDQEFYLVQEFIEGHPLSTELASGCRWDEAQVVQLIQEVLSILMFVHGHGVIHRDIKPSNLIRRQQDGRLVLIDFGAVKQIRCQPTESPEQTAATIAIGTPGYMATEQGRGRPRLNSDVYALGILAIQALTGLNPTQFQEDADTGEIVWQAPVSAECATVLNRMVCYHFKDRYQSASEALQALQPLVQQHQLPALPAAPEPTPVFQPESRNSQSGSATLPTLTVSRMPPVPWSKQSTFLAVPASTRQTDEQPDSALAAKPFPARRLLGLGLGTVLAVAVAVGFYYSPWSTRSADLEAQATATPTTGPSASPWTHSVSLERTLAGHISSVWSLAISPDGQTLASGSADKQVKLWDLRTGALRRTLPLYANAVMSLALSPDGQTLASGSYTSIVLSNLATGKPLRSLSGHFDSIWSLAISPDGRTLVSGSADRTIRVWELSSGKLLRTITGHADWVYAVVISPDGQTLISGSRDNTIKLWRLSDGQPLGILSGHMGAVRCLAISPDGRILASGSWDKTIKLWNLQTGELIHTLSGHRSQVVSLAFDPKLPILASSSVDNTIKLWDVRTAALLQSLSGHSDWVLSVRFSPDGHTLTSGSKDTSIKVWQVPDLPSSP